MERSCKFFRLDEEIAEVLYSELVEECTPALILLLKDCLSPDECLHARVAQHEVLNLHIVVDEVLELIKVDNTRAVFINNAKHLFYEPLNFGLRRDR